MNKHQKRIVRLARKILKELPWYNFKEAKDLAICINKSVGKLYKFL